MKRLETGKGGRPSYQKTKDRPITSDFIAGITVNTHCKLLVCKFNQRLYTLAENRDIAEAAGFWTLSYIASSFNHQRSQIVARNICLEQIPRQESETRDKTGKKALKSRKDHSCNLSLRLRPSSWNH